MVMVVMRPACSHGVKLFIVMARSLKCQCCYANIDNVSHFISLTPRTHTHILIAGYRDEVLNKVINMCSQNSYQYVTNFEWYVR